jgi:hypothetical protein
MLCNVCSRLLSAWEEGNNAAELEEEEEDMEDPVCDINDNSLTLGESFRTVCTNAENAEHNPLVQFGRSFIIQEVASSCTNWE